MFAKRVKLGFKIAHARKGGRLKVSLVNEKGKLQSQTVLEKIIQYNTLCNVCHSLLYLQKIRISLNQALEGSSPCITSVRHGGIPVD